MSLSALSASFGRLFSPGGAAESRPAARCVRASRPADDSLRLAVTMIRGVAAIPAGRERAKACAARRAEIVQGIESVLRALEVTEEALRAPAVLRAGPRETPAEAAKCLRWAASTTNALQTATRTLRTLDSCSTPEREYSEIAEQLSIIKETLRDLWGIVLVACQKAAEPTALGLDKLEAPSETCSTASGCSSGCASEASSEADCDSPRRCSSRDALAAAPAPNETCKGMTSRGSWSENRPSCAQYWA